MKTWIGGTRWNPNLSEGLCNLVLLWNTLSLKLLSPFLLKNCLKYGSFCATWFIKLRPLPQCLLFQWFFPFECLNSQFCLFSLHFMSFKGCLSCEELLVPWKETLQTQVILQVWLLRANRTVNKLGSGASQLLFRAVELSFSDCYQLPHS